MAAAPRPSRRTCDRSSEAGLIRRLALVATVAAVVAASSAPAASADGDPASDVLYTQWVFFPFEASIRKPVSQRLEQVVQSARSDGYPIKVAIITIPADLGTAYVLWRKPQQYAEFLGQELVFLYKGRLLIVMPDGFGVFHYKHSVAAERSVLARLTVAQGTEGMVDSATTAVAKLATAASHPIPVPPPAVLSGPAGGSGSKLLDRLIIAAAGAAFVILLVVVPVVHRRRARAAR